MIDRFVAAYESGATPNPCIDCNRYLKFERLFQRAMKLGCEAIVTGHYARIEKQNGRYILKKALDKSKDQSYVLYMLTQEQLAHICFPLGELSKSEVRSIADRYRQTEQSATAYPDESGKIRLLFDKPQRAITAGQAVVLYDRDTVMGGGIIC